MRPLDLLDYFDKAASTIGFVATYDFNPQFFERRLLANRTYNSAERIVVFMDRGRYRELLNAGLTVAGFNRRYLVVPLDRAPYVFHPKLYLALSETRADAVVGSNNCTNAGIAYNVEVCSTFTVSAEKAESSDRHAKSAIRQVFDAMREFSAGAGPLHDVLETEFLLPAESKVPWLNRKVALPKGDVGLLHSYRESLWSQVNARLQKLKVRNITVVAPFFDQDLGLLNRLRSVWPQAIMCIIAQEDYATLAGRKLAKLFTKRKDALFAALVKPGRRLHAKTFAFETNDGTYWITGSANPTTAAFDGRNTEAVLWFQTQEGPDAVFESGPFKLQKMDPQDFAAGKEQEPRNDHLPTGDLTLNSALLGKAGSLDCEAEGFGGLRNLALRVRNFNEAGPVLSVPVKFDAKRRSSVSLDEAQIAQIRGTALCQLKGVNSKGEDKASNEVALAQLHELLRERSSHGGSRNPLQTISETGENLVPYIDSLGSVREAVEFFNNCNIRFLDGESSGRSFRPDLWKPRDPFKPDTPPTWVNVPAGGSAEDLRQAIWDFVQRHQWEKLYRHVRRGNLNGLPNFLDIFRTLNGLLLTYHSRTLAGSAPIVPFGHVTRGIMINLELLIGPFEDGEDDSYEGRGFVASIFDNLKGDREMVRERLEEERVPQMLRASVEAMVDCRARARKMTQLDAWALKRLRWVAGWIESHGLEEPTAEDVRAAGMEYSALAAAA
jgi:HKD family nuclease